MVTPETAAPDASWIAPVTVARSTCALAGSALTMTATTNVKTLHFMVTLPQNLSDGCDALALRRARSHGRSRRGDGAPFPKPPIESPREEQRQGGETCNA